MADFLELICFARRLLGVPSDLIADQVTTTADKCTVLFADGQTSSFRITEIREGRRIIQRPAVLVELESGMALPVIPAQLPGNKSSTGGVTQTATDPRKRALPAGATENAEAGSSERVEDFITPINEETTVSQPSTSSRNKSNSGTVDNPNLCPERELKRPRTYYNVICKCPKTENPDVPPARDTLRRKAMLGGLVRGSPRKLRPIPIRTKTYSKNLKTYKVPKLPIKIKPKTTDKEKAMTTETEKSTARPQPVETVPTKEIETIPPEPVEPAQPSVTEPTTENRPAEPAAPSSSSTQSQNITESELEFRQFMRERIWSMKETMQKMSELQESTQTELQAIKLRNEQLERELRETREIQLEREEQQRQEELDYEEEERRHREEYRERYGHDDQHDEPHYEPRRVVNRGRGSLMVAKEAERCFKCGDRGHHSSNCARRPGEFKCYRCEGFGHKSFQCPNNKQARYGKRSNTSHQGDGGSNKRSKQNRYDQYRRGGFARRGRGNYFGNRRSQGRFRPSSENFSRETNYNEGQAQNYKRGNFKRGRGRRRGHYQNNSERENRQFSNQNSNHSNSRTGVSNRSEQQEKKVMPVQNQANLVVPPQAAPVPLPPPPFPMPFWYMPPQPPVFNYDPNVNSSTIEDRLNRIREEEERQRETYNVTSTKKSFQERADKRDRDDGANGAAYMAGGSRGRGRGRMLRV